MVLNITQFPFPDMGIDTYMTHQYRLNTEETYLVTNVCQQFTPLLHPLFTSYHRMCLSLLVHQATKPVCLQHVLR